ncbi:DUF1549 and DUF1553 domain-containing protein [Rubinisphaera margarita]|uniref:DUF1549 and DUF1553 domain-containing protein n=1 Tax=Rubinisphaera margarita TaxID=2909586 RepID=UPI001EE92445|nr:DUF1549 and DUF1553 domain-containing protein [Rubinisphaera margarita]MCG6154673.1 DUF1549 and DUF1553 domain-containing protein [Rubinisphaera margarita]
MQMRLLALALGLSLPLALETASRADTIPSIDQRFNENCTEVPDFQRHLLPMMSKIGCNGRSCHGSFQGRGGFQLSLFGYDFNMDHKGLSERIDTEDPLESYALHKATNVEEHEGGERIVKDSWQYHVFLKWIASGAQGAEKPHKLTRLEVTPSEIVFQKSGQSQSVNVVAVWEDGTREDVTPLCRFQSNDTSIAEVDENGKITAASVGDSHVVVFYDNGIYAVPVIQPVSDRVGDKYPQVAAPTRVDELVVEKLRKLGVVQSDVCTDEEFLRRVSLDIAGTLPTPEQVLEFAKDTNPHKRNAKIDELLETPAYTAWWATRLNDMTGNTVNQLNNVSYDNNKVTQEWFEWVRLRVERNVPYDKIVEGIVLASSQREDETYEDYSARMSETFRDDSCQSFAEQDSLPYFWARRNFQKDEDRAIGFAYTFLGIRIQCAQCHKHPFDQWTQEDFTQFQPVFARTRYSANGTDRKEYQKLLASIDVDETLRGNQLRRELAKELKKGKVVPFPALIDTPPRTSGRNKGKAPQQTARMLGGDPFNLNEYDNPREPLMQWLRTDVQDLFARAFVNRVWANYFHRGIVEPTDDLSMANPPSNAALLDHLTQGFIASSFDMKWLHREICNSRTYQLSWQPNETNIHDDRNFGRAVPRRIHAEVALDAIAQATSESEKNSSYLTSLDGRAIAIPGSGQGRGGNNYALTIFGKSARENNCDCERSSEPTLLQTLYLNNDNELLSSIESRRGWLDELAREWKVSSPAKSNKEARPANYDEVIARYEKYLAKVKKQDDPKKIQEVKSRLRAYREKYGDSEEAQPAESTKVAAVDYKDAVQTAYLRTLSRQPSESELATAVEAIRTAESPLVGMRDLLWALLNTKEFIVNH